MNETKWDNQACSPGSCALWACGPPAGRNGFVQAVQGAAKIVQQAGATSGFLRWQWG